jgi:hypothetical protein
MADSSSVKAALFSAEGTGITARVVAEFNDEGLPATVPMQSFGVEETRPPTEPTPPPDKPASPEQVRRMVESADEWEIAVTLTSGVFVVSQRQLREALETDTDPVSVDARRASASERLLVESAPKLLGPEASFDRVKGALGLPVAQVALIGTAAGLFGLSELEDKIARPTLVFLAVLCAMAAVAMSLWGTYALEKVTFVPARVDLVRKRYQEMVSKPLKASNRGVLLLLAAAVLALFAVWPASGADEEQRSTISTTIQRSADGHVAVVEADWSSLKEEVAAVETTVTRGAEVLGSARALKEADGTASQKLEISVDEAGQLEIESRAVDSAGAVVGETASESATVPEPG